VLYYLANDRKKIKEKIMKRLKKYLK